MAGKGKKEEEGADKMLPPEQKPRPRYRNKNIDYLIRLSLMVKT
jgi:hypothetical protein